MKVPAALPGFSQAAAQCLMAQLLLYPILKASWPSEERLEPIAWLQSQAHGLALPSAPTCTSRKDGVQMTYLMLEINVGHRLGRWASCLVGKL